MFHVASVLQEVYIYCQELLLFSQIYHIELHQQVLLLRHELPVWKHSAITCDPAAPEPWPRSTCVICSLDVLELKGSVNIPDHNKRMNLWTVPPSTQSLNSMWSRQPPQDHPIQGICEIG